MLKRPPKGSKVILRDLGRAGVPDTNHTSIRLDDNDKRLLAELAAKRYGGITKSACFRILLREAAAKEGIE